MVAQRKQYYSVQEYFQDDARSDTKLEFYDGVIIAQAGATARHNLIVANLIGHLYAKVLENGCTIFPSDIRVQAVDQRMYTYPDVTIVCGQPQYAEPNELTLVNPTAIIEILSSSSEVRDRKEKLEFYRKIESLQAYILIAQNAPYIQYYSRQTPHFWYVHLIDDRAANLHLASLNLVLTVDSIYTGISFS